MKLFSKLIMCIILCFTIVSCSKGDYLKDYELKEIAKNQIGATDEERSNIQVNMKNFSDKYSMEYENYMDSNIYGDKTYTVNNTKLTLKTPSQTDSYSNYYFYYQDLSDQVISTVVGELLIHIPINESEGSIDLTDNNILKDYFSIFYEDVDKHLDKYNTLANTLSKQKKDNNIESAKAIVDGEDTKISVYKSYIEISTNYRILSTLEEEEKNIATIKSSAIPNKYKERVLTTYDMLLEYGMKPDVGDGDHASGALGDYFRDISYSYNPGKKYERLYIGFSEGEFDNCIDYNRDLEWTAIKLLIDNDKDITKLKEAIADFCKSDKEGMDIKIGGNYCTLGKYGEVIQLWIYTKDVVSLYNIKAET
ncbi:MAG: hypothetical protein ACRDA5_10030 [Clostridium sp.]